VIAAAAITTGAGILGARALTERGDGRGSAGTIGADVPSRGTTGRHCPDPEPARAEMIYVCNLQEMPGHCMALAPSHLVSLVAPGELPPTPDSILIERHLRLEVHDITEALDGHVLPQVEHVAQVVEFMRAWSHAEGPLLIHCFAGISRSMAAALIGLVVKAGGREEEAAALMRRTAPHAWPNARMIALADEILGCEGRLIAAREAMGPADLTLIAPLVCLPLLD
jgi:predicted protein tyrosine phosphatase